MVGGVEMWGSGLVGVLGLRRDGDEGRERREDVPVNCPAVARECVQGTGAFDREFTELPVRNERTEV
jgi:hypothetical protein